MEIIELKKITETKISLDEPNSRVEMTESRINEFENRKQNLPNMSNREKNRLKKKWIEPQAQDPKDPTCVSSESQEERKGGKERVF